MGGAAENGPESFKKANDVKAPPFHPRRKRDRAARLILINLAGLSWVCGLQRPFGNLAVGKTILAIDSSKLSRTLVITALSEAGFEVVQAADAEEGLRMLATRGGGIDLIIAGMDPPRLDGISFVETVRKGAVAPTTPILILSRDGDDLDKARARRAGATGWVMQPFQAIKLVDFVCRAAA